MVPGDSHLESTAKQGNEITAQNVSRGLNMGHSSYVTETLRYIVSNALSLKVCLHVTSPTMAMGTLMGTGIMMLRVNRLLLFKCSFTLAKTNLTSKLPSVSVTARSYVAMTAAMSLLLSLWFQTHS